MTIDKEFVDDISLEEVEAAIYEVWFHGSDKDAVISDRTKEIIQYVLLLLRREKEKE